MREADVRYGRSVEGSRDVYSGERNEREIFLHWRKREREITAMVL